MFITFSYLDKPTKTAAKQINKGKDGKKFSLPFGKERFSVKEAEQHLRNLSKALHEADQPVGNFTVTLVDSEGMIETAGTIYEFGPIQYSVEDGLGASLVEVIQKDIYAETDENMSVEESYRNDKLIETLDQAIDEKERIEPETEADQPSWEQTSGHVVDEVDLDKEIQEERALEEEKEPFESAEVQKDLDPVEENPLIEKYQAAEEKTEQEPKQFFDYEAYISPISDSSELFTKQDEELEELTNIQTLLANCVEEEPWLNEKIKQFLQSEYAQSDVSNLKQVFDRTRQEALSKTRALLAEQYRSIQEDKVEERAYSQLTPTLKALEEQFADSLQQFVGSLEEKWQSREQELQEKESQEIERISKEIQGKYTRIKNNEQEEKEVQISKFTEEEQEKFTKEKAQLLDQEKAEIIKEHDETLTQVRIEAKKETEDHIKQVFTNAVQVIQDKNKAILAAVNNQVKGWKEEHQKELAAKEEAVEKERKEAIRQQRIQLQKEKQALKKKELQLKEMEMGKETAAPAQNSNQPLVVAYPPSNDQGNSKTDLLIAELMKEVQELKQSERQVNHPPGKGVRNKFSGLFISAIVLGSLAIGGLSAGLYSHFSGANAKADVQTVATTSIKTDRGSATPQSDSGVIKQTDALASADLESNDSYSATDQDKIREFLFQAGNKDQLESFNHAYPSTIGDLEVAILNNHAVNALKAYEKLSEEEKKDLGHAQKLAVRAYYTANNEISKAEEVK